MWRKALARLGIAVQHVNGGSTAGGVGAAATSASETVGSMVRPAAPNSSSNSSSNGGVSFNEGSSSSHNSGISASKQAAHEVLRNAVRELSEGTATSMTPPPQETLEAMALEDPQTMNVDELCALASANFQGVPNVLEANQSKGVELWRIAADRGSLDAIYSLAVCLRDGNGVDKDLDAARVLLAKLANDSNYNIAHYALAIMLTNGEGGPVDDAAAFKHFKAAAKGGILPALHNVANFYASGKGGVKQSDHNALLYYQAAVDAGDPSAKFTVGVWAAQGRSMEKDLVKSFRLQIEAAHAGHPAAMFNVGVMYMSGEGTTKDLNAALQWYEKAAQRGIAQASVNLGNMYRTGLGVERDLHMARTYFAQYAEKDDVSKELSALVDTELAPTITSSGSANNSTPL